MAAPPAPAPAMPMPTGGNRTATTPTGQAPAEPDGRAVAGRLLVLLDDVDLSVLVLGDDGRVEIV
jgi:hypothetical protein